MSSEHTLRKRIRALERELAQAAEKELTHQEVRETIFCLAETGYEPRLFDYKLPVGHPGTPVICLGDWHAGEVVRPDEIGHANRFNTTVLTRRVSRVVETAIGLAKQHLANGTYKAAYVPLLGDMVSGEIHDELSRTNEASLFQSIIIAADLLTSALLKLQEAFGRIHCPAVCGNHGRIDRKWQVKSFTVRNADWLIYQMVEARLRAMGVSTITIDAPASNEVLFTVHNTSFLAVHGHDLGVKGGDGMIGPLGPILRGRYKMESQKAALGQRFDHLLIGHWHFSAMLPGVIVNGTLKGYDEFAAHVLRAKPAPPSQSMFFVHPRTGIASYWNIFGEEPKA
jgi:hypothetical protein